jgi:hypothetical protein
MPAHISSALCLLLLFASPSLAQAGSHPDTTELTLLALDAEADSTEVVRVLGRPDSVRSYEHPHNADARLLTVYYRNAMVFLAPDGLKEGVKLITPANRTRRGLRVGDSASRALQLYGTPDERNQAELRWWISGQYNPQLVVEVHLGRVVSIFAGYVID